MKRFVSAVLAICFVFCGCGVIKENSEIGAYVPVSELDMSNNEYQGRVEKSAVYFLNPSGTLTAELRTIVIGQDTNPAAVAVEELLEGPSNDDLESVAPEGMILDFIEYSRDVANVYLLYDGETMQEKERYILELALANTITDLLGATYISVFYNGVQMGYYGAPCAPNKKQTGSIEDAWLQASAAYQLEVPVIEDETAQPSQTTDPGQTDENIEPEPIVNKITTVLYFISADGGYILPEVRDVEYIDDDYIGTLIDELQKGPQNTSAMTSPLADDIELLEVPVLTATGDGAYTLTLNFSELPTQYDDSDEEDAILSYAALIYTITGFVPDIINIDIYVKGTQITSVAGTDMADGLQRDDYTGYIGSSAPLYFADTDSDLLLEVARSMEQGQIWSAKARVLEILKGPLSGDGDNARPVMPTGTTQADILSVDVYKDTAYVDLSQNFKDACAGFSAKSEMLLVYSIVNTVTAMDGITKVQFLVEGGQIETLAGYLCLADPFLKNYGIIKTG
ncbi:MAG: GerMN domain-containing protein [Eubacteriales bacterium]|nr:GerMN domain-containing protein [Eubacteriales bacterium]